MSYDLYRVASTPTWWGGRRNNNFKIGDLVEVRDYSDPDDDGDVDVRRAGSEDDYFPYLLNRACLVSEDEPKDEQPTTQATPPVVSTGAVRAALALHDVRVSESFWRELTTIDAALKEAL